MQAYNVRLESPVSNSYRCKRAADSLDIDTTKKSVHELKINADLKTNYNVGLILGASGSGKTTLAKKIFGENCFETILDQTKPIIEQFPQSYDYDKCASLLSGVGLTSVPCWIRPVYTLSNGQKARAEAALLMCRDDLTIIDEWTSVVDRTVAKVMSHCIQKHSRKSQKQIILLSCHYDVIEWLNPDWIIDCNKQEFIDRRLLRQDERERKEKLEFTIRKVDKSTWKYFSKYHYLSEKLPGGFIKTFGIFNGENQIGFQCFANYVPDVKNKKRVMHSNRVVIHPDYSGLGLGIKMVNTCAEIMKKENYKVMAKFSSIPMLKSRIKDKKWKLKKIDRLIGKMQTGSSMDRKGGFRENIKTYSFEFVG